MYISTDMFVFDFTSRFGRGVKFRADGPQESTKVQLDKKGGIKALKAVFIPNYKLQ